MPPVMWSMRVPIVATFRCTLLCIHSYPTRCCHSSECWTGVRRPRGRNACEPAVRLRGLEPPPGYPDTDLKCATGGLGRSEGRYLRAFRAFQSRLSEPEVITPLSRGS